MKMNKIKRKLKLFIGNIYIMLKEPYILFGTIFLLMGIIVVLVDL